MRVAGCQLCGRMGVRAGFEPLSLRGACWSPGRLVNVRGVVAGLAVGGGGFEVLAGSERVGPRRVLGPADAELLTDLGGRYVRAVQAGSDAGVFAGLGLELAGWLEGDGGQLSALLDRAERPLVFEVTGPREPSEPEWAVLRAPFELLARPGGGLLAEEELTGFCVVRRLGTAADRPGLDGFRLGLAFMASSPRGQQELDFEAEEAAILGAVDEDRADLLVEDTGDPEQLARRLAGLGGMPVVHLSCHGLNSWRARPGAPGVPVLMMEDDAGGDRPVTAGELARLLRVRPRLLFVSACLTAAAADTAGHLPPGSGHKDAAGAAGCAGQELVAHSMATALVTAGMPAVIGWDGSVGDMSATLFAERLYRGLADRADVEIAVGDARRVLLESEDPVVRADWHLARLWLGPGGGGPLVAGRRKRSLIPAAHGTQTFLDRKQQVPVAVPEMFVGRRPELQRALRALRSGRRAGVLLRGQGRLGKSSLAARIADRFPSHAKAVVFGDYSALGILDAVAAALPSTPAARDMIESRLPEIRHRAEAIGPVLADLLTGPCAQDDGDSGRPLLLILDDLEQILTVDPEGPHQVAAGHAEVLAAVLAAFDPAQTDSRLLITSRYAFTLRGLEARLEDVQIPPLSDVARLKLHRRQQALTPPGRQAERAGLAGRAVAVSRGNPGLQDLIGLKVVYGEHVSQDRAEAAVAGMEAYLRQGGLPGDAEVREFLENLALDTLLEEAGPADAALLRAVTLFTVPVPGPVVAVLAGQVGGSVARLRGLGLLDPYPDLRDPAVVALAASPLAAGRLDRLSPAEQEVLAAAAARPLLEAWGGPSPQPGRDPVLDVQLATLALLAGEPEVLAVCAAGAVAGLRGGPASAAQRIGQDAIALLDRHDHPVPLTLLRRTADAALTSGDGDTGTALLTRAAAQAQAGREPGSDPLGRARVIAEQARHLITRGELRQAGQLLGEARQLFTAAGSESEAAAVMGSLADVAYERGEYDEALRIRREVQLPVYERLGDARSAAVAWGKIADIAYQRGEYDEALRIRRDVELPVYERLGDAREAAVAWGKIADIAYERGEYDEALRIRREVTLPVYERLGDARSAAVTWGQIADIAYRRGEYDEALRIRREVTLPVYERLGDARSAAVTWGKIADIAYQRGEYDEALRIRREVQLPVYERLGDAREAAVTWGQIADIAYQRGEYDEALRIRREVTLPVYERLGDARSAAVTWGKIADIAYQRGEYDEAADRWFRQLEACRHLGDLDGIASAGWGLARIDLAKKDYQSALPRLTESFEILTRLQRPDGVAAVGGDLGQLLIAGGQPDTARQILRQALAAATKIGWNDMAQQISSILQDQPPETT